MTSEIRTNNNLILALLSLLDINREVLSYTKNNSLNI